jgi:hypothetical protein
MTAPVRNDVAIRASFKTSHFGQSQQRAQISILKILNVFFRLKYSPAFRLRLKASP